MERSKVLIVEDDVNLRETWDLMFDTFGVSVDLAENGLEATQIMRSNDFFLIVTDLQMPVEDGYFVLEYIKSNKLDLITWVCTGHLFEESLKDYKIDRVINKPFSMLNEVKEIIRLSNEFEVNQKIQK
jgi:CheY-like chemotaxis protein